MEPKQTGWGNRRRRKGRGEAAAAEAMDGEDKQSSRAEGGCVEAHLSVRVSRNSDFLSLLGMTWNSSISFLFRSNSGKDAFA